VQESRPPVIVAHRGSSGVAPENTIAAFRRAVEDRADMIEFDVRLSSDAELVVIHDRTLRRTARGRGAVRSMVLASLKTYDAGAWFSEEFSGEKIPTLQEVFDILPSTMPLDIEVKTDGDRRRAILLTSNLVACIGRNHAYQRVIVTSFDHRFLRHMHITAPRVTIGALVFPGTRRRPEAYVRRLGARWLVYAQRQVNRRVVERAHRSGLHVGCYTVNTERDYRRIVRSGVDAIITNYPATMRALRAR
jgi:glycerophosphoryl diester phosphodiesterase